MIAHYDMATTLLRRLNPETAHNNTIRALRAGFGPQEKKRSCSILNNRVAGLNLNNIVGLAAGFDKDAVAPDQLLKMGFGFVECGTVTPLPQTGNSKPRVFRLTADRAIINRMGFNSVGLDGFIENISRRSARGIVGVNIGANKESNDRIKDYVCGLDRVSGHCDYVTVNISSPNTPGLRNLQTKMALDELLGKLAETRRLHAAKPPIFLKVAPDLSEDGPEIIISAVRRHGLDGIIISNTTLDRPEGLKSAQAHESGGLSGVPLFQRSTALLRTFREADVSIPLIGVGGISSGADAYAKVRAGANAVQLYSALVYEGAGLLTRIKQDLAARLRADGFDSVAAAVGA